MSKQWKTPRLPPLEEIKERLESPEPPLEDPQLTSLREYTARVVKDIEALQEWVNAVTRVYDKQMALLFEIVLGKEGQGGLVSSYEGALDKISELNKQLDGARKNWEHISASAVETEKFAKQQMDILTHAQKAIGLEDRLLRVESTLKLREGRKNQSLSNWLAVVGLIVAIVLGITGTVLSILP